MSVKNWPYPSTYGFMALLLDKEEGVVLPIPQNNYDRPDFRIYPNPASSIVHFTTGDYPGQIQTIELFDMQGRKVANIQPLQSTATLDISHLPDGVYIIRVSTSNDVMTRKLVKK